MVIRSTEEYMSLRRSLTSLSALTLLAVVPACGSDDSGSSPGDAASETAAYEAGATVGADASPEFDAAASDGAIDAKGNPNNTGADAAADTAEESAADGRTADTAHESAADSGTADAAMDAANDATSDGTVDAQKDATNDAAAESAADAQGDVANDVTLEAAADAVADGAHDVATDGPVDAKVLDAFPEAGFVIPDASNDSGGSTAACETCAVNSCDTQLIECLTDPECVTAESTLATCLDSVGGDSGTTIIGCLTALTGAGSSTIALGTCLLTSCATPCGVPPGFDAGP
jgi:hypothetical protein